MSDLSQTYLWAVILGIAAVTFLIRWSFIGLIGARELPEWLDDALGFVPVAVLPALVAPRIFEGPEGGLVLDPMTLGPAIAALGVGFAFRNLLASILAGAGVFGLLHLVGV